MHNNHHLTCISHKPPWLVNSREIVYIHLASLLFFAHLRQCNPNLQIAIYLVRRWMVSGLFLAVEILQDIKVICVDLGWCLLHVSRWKKHNRSLLNYILIADRGLNNLKCLQVSFATEQARSPLSEVFALMPPACRATLDSLYLGLVFPPKKPNIIIWIRLIFGSPHKHLQVSRLGDLVITWLVYDRTKMSPLRFPPIDEHTNMIKMSSIHS